MHLILDEVFKKNHLKIIEFIAQESKQKAINFNNSLFIKMNKLPYMPYKFRQSHYYDDMNVRDLIFKGYTLPYLIDHDADVIVILDIFKWSER